MNHKSVIIVKNISKTYPRKPQLMRRGEDTFVSFLSKKLLRQGKQDRHFQALKNVSFSVNAGESVGFVGYNGAGKSTLLRVITGITAPTSGEVEIIGNHGELFALNAGFNQDLSGRKNIFLIAAIKGFSKDEIEGRVEDIIRFSELGEFIDQPVKVYSSGMKGRLGFSVLIHLLPDIIFIDEALATGDRKFRKKCLERLEDIVSQNRTLVMVSHSTEILENLCTRIIWLDKGEILEDGSAAEVLSAYKEDKKARRKSV